MNNKFEKILEFDVIKSMLSEKASCELSKHKINILEPMTDISEIRVRLNETDDAVNMILRKGTPPLGGVKDVRRSLLRAATGGMLSFSELLAAGGLLKACRRTLDYASGTDENEENLIVKMISRLTEDRMFENQIFRAILSEEEMSDDASPQLRSIRRQIADRQNAIKTKLNEVIHSQKYSKAIQENLVTLRGGRYCIPVKVEYKSELPGMVHDMSSSGQTVFIEPAFVVEANNKIRELRAEEKKEVERITLELSEGVGNRKNMLLENLENLTEIDFTFAKARIALDMKAQKPLVNSDGHISIVKGRHPLIDKHKVVPISVDIGYKYSTLVITGPNTGGKTVALKTIGLFSAMMQSGLLVPAESGTELSVYDEIYADIGDEQSITQSLSTFSSHMKNIVDILGNFNGRVLVLFDELGAGTDPAEGAALAMAILECVNQMGATTVATTHYSELKVFTATTPGFENACCEFDVDTLKPTYRLLTGIPGKSNAFAISEKLGLDKVIVDRAKEFLSQEDLRFEDMLTGIEKSRAEIEAKKTEIERLHEETTRLKDEIKRQQESFSEQKNKMVAKAREEAREILMNTRKEADRLLSQMRRDVLNQNHEGLKKAEALGRELANLQSETDEKLYSGYGKNSDLSKPPKTVSIGQSVKIVSINGEGVVLKEPDKNGSVYVQAGIMKIYVPISDLRILNDKGKDVVTSKASAASRAAMMKGGTVKTELDIRGYNVDEAKIEMDKYIDDVILAHLKKFSVIHGKGTGVLRNGVHDFLKRDKRVKTFRIGAYGEGDFGVTVVELK